MKCDHDLKHDLRGKQQLFKTIIVCKLNPKYQNSTYGAIRFLVTPMMLVDLAAILPFFLPFVIADTRFIRIVRLLRLFRLFKLARYSDPMQTLGDVFKSKAGDLAVAFFYSIYLLDTCV